MIGIVELDLHEKVVVAFTGTHEKFKTLEKIVRPEGTFVPGIIGILQFEGAGAAKEPVTTDCVDLIMAKQRRQRQLQLTKVKIHKNC